MAGVPEIVGAELEEEDPDDVPDPEGLEDDELEPLADCVAVAAEAPELEPPQPESRPIPRPAPSKSNVSLPEIRFIR